MPSVELTTMCMVMDRTTNRVLVQDRAKSWRGISFPGGHVEDGESIVGATIREIKEETGLEVSDLEFCGLVNWYNDRTKERYLVFNYRTECWSGELLTATEEGKVFWTDIGTLPSLPLASGFAERLPMFLEGGVLEGFAVWNASKRTSRLTLL
ncbi:MAG: 8-oxo-dGTP diphosphatase [Bacillota bacterium]